MNKDGSDAESDSPSLISDSKGGAESLEEKIARVMRGISIVSLAPKVSPPQISVVGYNTNTNLTTEEAQAAIMETSPKIEIIKQHMQSTDSIADVKIFVDQHNSNSVPFIPISKTPTPPPIANVLDSVFATKLNAPGAWSLTHSESNIDCRSSVAVRVRPLNGEELRKGSRNILSCNAAKIVIVNPRSFDADPNVIAEAAFPLHLNEWAKEFRFEHILFPSNVEQIGEDDDGEGVSLQRTIGAEVVENILNGNSCCCFAFGHCNTGKMTSLFFDDSENRKTQQLATVATDRLGLFPRMISNIVDGLKLRDGACDDTKVTFSFLEIFNEKIFDLLPVLANSPTVKQESLRIREHPSTGPYVEGLIKTEIFSGSDVVNYIRHGLSRKQGHHRSHSVLVLELSSCRDQSLTTTPDKSRTEKRFSSASKKDEKLVRNSNGIVRLYAVDLACPDVDTAKGESGDVDNVRNTGSARKSMQVKESQDKTESKLIRRSLSTLGYVIKSIAKGSNVSVLPFRDSPLTWLLKDSLIGKCKISLLVTLSPSHFAYEESLNALKFAEQFSASRHQDSDMMKDVHVNNEFTRMQIGLGADKPGSLASKQLLKETICDPRQRLAKFKDHFDDKSVSMESGSGTHDARGIEELRNSYRILQGQLVELQIELDTARTDRDSYMVELKHARESLSSLQFADVKSSATSSSTSNGKDSSKDKSELREIISRKDDMIEKLLEDVKDEKQKNIRLNEIHSAQSTDFLSKIEKLQRDLVAATAEIKSLRKSSSVHTKEQEQALIEYDKLKAAYEDVNSRLARCQDDMTRSGNIAQSLQREINSIKYAYNTIEASMRDQVAEVDRYKGQIEVLAGERDSLLATSLQLKSLIAVKSQQSEESMQLQWRRQEALEKMEKDSEFGIDQLNTIQSGLQKLFATEGNLLHSEVLDAKILTGMLASVRERLQDVNSLRIELEKERSMRLQLQQGMANQNRLLADDLPNDVQEQLSKYRKMSEVSEAKAQYWQSVAQRVKAISPSSMKPIAVSDDNQQLTYLREENEHLRSQLATTAADAALAKATLEKSQESMQQEFSSLWIAVQELNKLDAAKEKALAELINDRDQAVTDRANALLQLTELSRKYQMLQQDLEAIDRDLLDAAAAEHIDISFNAMHPNHANQFHATQLYGPDSHRNAPKSPQIETVVQNQIAELSGFLNVDKAKGNTQQRRVTSASNKLRSGIFH